MNKTKVAIPALITTTLTFALAGCAGEAGAPTETSAGHDALVNVYWTNVTNGRKVVNHTSATRAEVDAMLAARAEGKKAVGLPDVAAGSLGVSREAVTTGSTDWANACVSYEWFLVTSAPDAGGDIFCAHYDAPFTHDGIAMPFVPAWYDASYAAYFSICTSASDCFLGACNGPFTTNWVSVAPGYDGGAGVNISPPSNAVYINGQLRPMTCVNSVAGLNGMRNDLGASYTLTSDITMNGNDPPFAPVGSPFEPFTGTFDGSGFTIRNLRIDNPNGWYTGLFSYADGATLSGVQLENVTVVGGGYTGAIVGSMMNTTLTDSYVTGTVTGESVGVGMAVGVAGNFTDIERCYATGTIGGPVSIVGGFIGEVNASGFDDQNGYGPVAKINEIFTNVNVSPTITGYPITAGGLVGEAEAADIEDINVVGPVLGQGMVGGVIGHAINDDPNSQAIDLLDALSRANVTDASGYDPAGVVGVLSGYFQRCDAFYELELDSGYAVPAGDTFCNAGFSSSDLRAPHPAPNPFMYPFTVGMIVTQEDIDAGYYDACKLASGSDRDWGFGCDAPQTWSMNSSYEHNTLTRIPNPGIQPR